MLYIRISKAANNYKNQRNHTPHVQSPTHKNPPLSRRVCFYSWIPSALQTTRNPNSMMGPAHPVQVLSVRHLALAVLSHAVLQNALRHASGDWRETVLAGGSVLPQKQQRKGRAAYFSAESGTEYALSSPTRETGLEHMRARQQERIASETPEETAAMCARSNKCSVFIRVSSQSEHYFIDCVAKLQLISWIAPARQKCTAYTY